MRVLPFCSAPHNNGEANFILVHAGEREKCVLKQQIEIWFEMSASFIIHHSADSNEQIKWIIRKRRRKEI